MRALIAAALVAGNAFAGGVTLQTIREEPTAKSVQAFTLDPQTLAGGAVSIAIGGKTARIVGKATETGWQGIGEGDGRLTDSLTLAQGPEGFHGRLRFKGRAFEVVPLGQNSYALVERREPGVYLLDKTDGRLK